MTVFRQPLPRGTGDQQLRLELLGRLLDPGCQVHHVTDDRVFLALLGSHVACSPAVTLRGDHSNEWADGVRSDA